MATGLAPPPEQGQLVSARSRNWIVNEVAPSTLPTDRLDVLGRPQTLVSLASVEDDGLGEELRVVWELEPGTRVNEEVALPEPTGFAPPDRLNAFLDAVRWGASSSADIRTIQAPFRSGIDIEDYQLDPVARANRMPRVNLLVADDVGLGKTIEAGMVALELILRHRARKVLIVCPSSLQIQWQEQMRDKFGLDFRIVGSPLMRELRRERGIHANPWNHFPRLITSIDFLKRERPLRMFREILPGPDDPLYHRKFDLLIVDEAHNCAPSGRGKYATDSLRTRALRLLAPHFEHKFFLTATPHNDYPESFSALLELLDSQRFARSTPPDRRQLDAVMVRRLKSELPPRWDGSPRFPRRALEPLEVPYTDEEMAIHAALKRYAGLRSKRARDNAESVATDFVLKTLKKRLFSSPAAFLTTLNKHEASLRGASKPAGGGTPSFGILKRDLDRIDEDYADDEEYDEATGDAVDTASRLFSEPTAEELGLIRTMRDWAERACSQNDSKARALIAWLREHIRPDGRWSDERVILFTEYRATQKWLSEVLASEGFAGQDRLMTMYGGMDSKGREAVKAAFQSVPEQSPVRILLATDAASEGLDLQNHCSKLIHYEVPWNPNRMEQRNGRIDRHGQKADLVRVFHFVSEGYRKRQGQAFAVPAGELDADLEFLIRVAQKVETIREDLGSVGQVLADDVEAAMLGRGYALARTETAERGSEPVRKMLKFERDLARQIQDLLEQYRETQKEQRLTPANIRKVVEVGLDLAGQPPLIPVDDPGGRALFRLPALRGSWAACGEGLEHPHTGEIRPITFDHAASNGRDDVVLAHLNHRLVQMCLRLLRAEVWSDAGRKKMHRIEARVVPDAALPTPAVVAHARLVVIGGDSHRLHEEIITAGGSLKEGRFSRMNVGQVAEALAAASDEEPSEATKGRFLKLWGDIAPSLQQALTARMGDRTKGLEKRLLERADKEARDIESVLLELKRAIEAELKESEYRQLELFSDPEREQFERNKDFLRGRVGQIPGEIERETAAIRARFADPQARMFPVALTFLVPSKIATER
ncbi:DISARM system SNF2-like helicase DrmD [Tautonia plasticadhaerens]|uniref:RNA polymerase-associated protein RapA n=1 Tax=Tautonia plasticadhaerens TaxID=2527974 RepID=A0A518H4A5_9BACT|nr:DISARM system SNF2-like helicase DrmD [Tautonia plasticadhaerens]QDV35675.1 RNA polymerase-associated protein RapA [Tautonia plasticadhaerens]